LGLVESLGEFYPEAMWQRCAVHFYRNVWTAVPTSKVKAVAAMLKAIHAQEDRAAARQKAEQVVAKLKEMKLADAAALLSAGIEQTLYYYAFPREHWRPLRTNNPQRRAMGGPPLPDPPGGSPFQLCRRPKRRSIKLSMGASPSTMARPA
jgi:transposase-like protein